MGKLRILLVSVCLAASGASVLVAQSPSSPTFEVASVRRHNSGDPPVFFPASPGRVTMTNAPLSVLIQNAYSPLQDYQLVGGPSWLTSDGFDIIATVGGNPPAEQRPLMLRALLADRFKLVVHTETRELPIYALVLAKSDGALGARLRPAAVDCLAARGRVNGPPPAPPPTGQRVSCALRFSPGNVTAEGLPLALLADRLAPFVGRVVVDQTGLTGNFDFELEWTPDRLPQLPPDASQLPPGDSTGPSIFTALQEQLGLKLESTRGPVDVLVIDSVEHPTPD